MSNDTDAAREAARGTTDGKFGEQDLAEPASNLVDWGLTPDEAFAVGELIAAGVKPETARQAVKEAGMSEPHEALMQGLRGIWMTVRVGPTNTRLSADPVVSVHIPDERAAQCRAAGRYGTVRGRQSQFSS